MNLIQSELELLPAALDVHGYKVLSVSERPPIEEVPAPKPEPTSTAVQTEEPPKEVIRVPIPEEEPLALDDRMITGINVELMPHSRGCPIVSASPGDIIGQIRGGGDYWLSKVSLTRADGDTIAFYPRRQEPLIQQVPSPAPVIIDRQSGVEKELVELLKTVVLTQQNTMQGNQALLLSLIHQLQQPVQPPPPEPSEYSESFESVVGMFLTCT